VVSENSEDYLLVSRAEGKVNFSCSSVEWADAIMTELRETIDEWKRMAQARDLKHHRKDRTPRPESQPPQE
jgi:hypothetical protein